MEKGFDITKAEKERERDEEEVLHFIIHILCLLFT